ncbi:MAG TPA: ribonuclease Z [Bacillus sp. (in: firmicutes)]|uniref:ribonuclease Z n=1 Tax=Bacillus litorisediminis TaxID=2922713 RepID=UPI001FAC6561|nr:ribonuclease Z [Bacillus litorisediminis]HWO76177.1 ribonuclease Z [Bacillus sp. (in: firmicutes)]
MELLFLGTGSGVPSKMRNVTSIALKLLAERGTVWLFDCGEATQHQILHTNLKPRKLEKIFITHLHGDHIFGLPGLLGSRSFQGGVGRLTVYGPIGIKEYIETSLRLSGTHLKYSLKIEEFTGGVIFEDENWQVEVLPLQHGMPSYGFRITEKDQPGPLLIEKLKEIGIKPGPHFQKLKNGETVEYDGQVLNGKDFVGPPIKGRVVAILGDTVPCQTAVELSQNANIVVHEATFSEHEEEMARNYFHSTTKQAALLAREANARQLCMTHFSARYQYEDLAELVKEAKQYFPNVVAAYDFLEMDVPRE